MKEKVKVKFARYKNVVIMDVLEMPEKYRGKGELLASGRTSIRSVTMPDIDECTLYLSGDATKFDNRRSGYFYDTADEALEAIKRFSDLIHELNERDAETTEATEATADGEFEITMAE